MAYGAKYLIRFSDVYQNSAGQYEALIYKKDYTGFIYELASGPEPLVIETDRVGNSSFKPIVASNATVNLMFKAGTLKYWEEITDDWNLYTGTWDTDLFDFTEFLQASLDDFYIVIKKDGVLRWKGYYLPTSDMVITEIEPVNFSLNFSDLSLMRSERVFESNQSGVVAFDATERISILDMMLDAVYAANLDFEVRINFPYSKEQPDVIINNDGTLSPKVITMDEMYILKNALMKAPSDYYDYFTVLSGVCSSFGLMAYQKQGIFYISSYDQLINQGSRVYKRYASSGKTYLGEITESDNTVAVGDPGFKQLGRTQKVRFSLPYKYLEVDAESPRAAQNYNCFLWGFDYASGSLRASGINRVGGATVPSSKSIYRTSAVSPFNYRFGLKFLASSLALDYSQYWETKPLRVSEGDVISASAYWDNDALVIDNNPDLEASTFAFATLKYNDQDGTTRYLYTIYNPSVPNAILWNPTVTPGFIPTANFKGLRIPYSGELTIRILRPTAEQVNTNSAVYIEHLLLQVYKGEQEEIVPSKTISRSFYENIPNNNDVLSVNAIPYFFYGARYYVGNLGDPDRAAAAVVSNAIVDTWYKYVNDDFVYGESHTIQSSIGNAIQKNLGLLNVSLEGVYKSDFYDIGQKFSYDITGAGAKTFCLLDYRFSLKAAEQDSILYSCQYTDTTGLIFTNTTIEEF